MKAISLFLISLVISTGMFGTSFMTPKKAVPAFNSIEEILSTIDPNILPHGPYPGSFAEGANLNANYIEVLNQKAVEVRNYIAGKYAEDLSDFSNTDIITLAIMLVPFEQRDMFLGRVSNEQAFGCMMTALSGATGIAALVSAWNSGATASTILSTLKSILKVGYGWFAVGYAVYQFGDCVGWW